MRFATKGAQLLATNVLKTKKPAYFGSAESFFPWIHCDKCYDFHIRHIAYKYEMAWLHLEKKNCITTIILFSTFIEV